MSAHLTPAQVAERLGTDVGKVLRFIQSGQLRAINIALKPNGERPRWRIPAESVQTFELSRSTVPPPAPQRRKQLPGHVKEFV